MGEEQGLSAEEALERLVVFTAMEDAELATRCEAILKPILAARSEGLQPVSVKGEGGLDSLGASRAPSCVSAGVAETPSDGWQDIASAPEDGERCLVQLDPVRFGTPIHIDTWDGFIETFKSHGDLVVKWQRLPPISSGSPTDCQTSGGAR